jgi:hypothetical protein
MAESGRSLEKPRFYQVMAVVARRERETTRRPRSGAAGPVRDGGRFVCQE